MRGDVRDGRPAGDLPQVAALCGRGESTAMVTSGAIALGMRQMGMPVRPTAMEELQAASAVGQGPLYDVYAGMLAEHGVRSAQVLLTFFDISARMQYVNARRTLAKLLEWGVVPVVNENDTTATDEISFGDNDILAAQVGDPAARRPAGDPAPTSTRCTPATRAATPMPSRSPRCTTSRSCSSYEIGMSSSHLGSGGMRSKVLAAEMATAAGIPVVICNGAQPGTLARALAGEPVGTRFHPQERTSRASSCGCATRRRRADA